MAKLRKMLTHRGKNESGQGALAMVLILLMLGAIILTPLLVFMSTGLKAGQVYESKMQEFYAADAGVEDALWRIENAYPDLSVYFPDYDVYDYDTNYSYPVAPSASDHEINNENVTVNIANVWIPDVDVPDADDARDIIEKGGKPGSVMVTGSAITFPDDEPGYQIKINYYYDTDPGSPYYDPNGTNLKIDEIGVWLSGGFDYVPGDLGNLNGSVSSESVSHCGGKAIVWDMQDQAFKLSGQTSNPLVRTFDFQVEGPAGQYPQALSWIATAEPWMTTTEGTDVSLSWDADSKPYRIESTAGGTTTEAYVIKNELRKLGAAISGDYVAIGSSLMIGDVTKHDQLLMESSATVDSIPPDATVEGAYLYWSGWIDHFYWYKAGKNDWRWSADPDDWDVTQDNWTGLVYPTNPTPDNLKQMVETNAKVNTVNFGGGGGMQDITATQWQVWPKTNDAPACWYYTCFYDATSIVKPLIESGVSTFTLGHASSVIDRVRTDDKEKSHTYRFDFDDSSSDYTGYPLGTPAHKLKGESGYHVRYSAAHAGWSLVIIYSSPETQGHQLYLYDIKNPAFTFKESYPEGESVSNPDFDGDGNPGGKISGFLVPEKIEGEVNAARITCFVGEGDERLKGDYFNVTGPSGTSESLPDGTGADLNTVWNSKSVGMAEPGVDIDTFYVTWSSGILEEGDTWAQVDIPTGGDGFTLIYIILSFRSEITTGGTVSYLIRGGG